MVWVRVIEPDNAFPAAARQFQRGDYLLRIDAIAIRRRIHAHVFAGKGHGDQAVPVHHIAQKNATALMGIAALGFPANQIVVSLADLEHRTSPGKWRLHQSFPASVIETTKNLKIVLTKGLHTS